jgi:twinkle protein
VSILDDRAALVAASKSRMNLSDFDFAAYENPTPAKHNLIDPVDLVEGEIARQKAGGTMTGVGLPWPKTQTQVRLRPSEVSLWAGINGHGKSLLTGQVALSIVDQGEKVMIASMEMAPRATFNRQGIQAIGNSEPTDQAWREFGKWLSGNLWYYTPQGIVDPRKLLAAARFAAKELGVTHVFIDSLLKVVRRTDDYNAQKAFVEDCCAFGRETGCHMHIVAHIRKGDSETSGVPDKFDVAGHADVTNQVDNVFVVYKVKPDVKAKAEKEGKPDHDALLKVAKQRHHPWEGIFLLWFHANSMQFVESKASAKHDYLPSQKARAR